MKVLGPVVFWLLETCREVACLPVMVHLCFLFKFSFRVEPRNVDTFGTRPKCSVYRGVHISGVLQNVDTRGNRPKSPVYIGVAGADSGGV